MTRSNIKNLNYMSDLHSQTDDGVQFMWDDISEKLLEVERGGKREKGLLADN